MSDITERLRHFCTDWDGSAMDDQTEPMPGLHCIELREAAAEIARLRAEVEAMRADAERYRWLRQKIYIDPRQAILRIADTFLSAGDSVPDMLDAAIDVARTEGIKP